jgi:hypothetical protein
MQKARIGTPPLQRDVERFDRHVPIVDGTDGPAYDEPREQVEDHRQIELAATADDELRCVTDPALIRTRGLEPPVRMMSTGSDQPQPERAQSVESVECVDYHAPWRCSAFSTL